MLWIVASYTAACDALLASYVNLIKLPVWRTTVSPVLISVSMHAGWEGSIGPFYGIFIPCALCLGGLEKIGRALSWWPDRFPHDTELFKKDLADETFETIVTYALLNFCMAVLLVQWRLYPLLYARWKRLECEGLRSLPASFRQLQRLSTQYESNHDDVLSTALEAEPHEEKQPGWDNYRQTCREVSLLWSKVVVEGDYESLRHVEPYLARQRRWGQSAGVNKLPTILSSQVKARLIPRDQLLGLEGHFSCARAFVSAVFPCLVDTDKLGHLSLFATLSVVLPFLIPLPFYVAVIKTLKLVAASMSLPPPPPAPLIALLEALPELVKQCEALGFPPENVLTWYFPQLEKHKALMRAGWRFQNGILDEILRWKERRSRD